MNLTHQQARKWMQLALDGRLNREEQAALRAHLAACSTCNAEQARLAALDRDLRLSLSERWVENRFTPVELTGRLAGMEPHIRRKTMSQRFSPLPRALALTALVALLAFAALFISRNYNPQAQPGQPVGPGLTTVTPGEESQPTPTMFPGTLSPTEPAVEPEPTAEVIVAVPTEPVEEIFIPLSIFPHSLNWSPDGRWLAGLDTHRTLLIWNREQPQEPAQSLALPQDDSLAGVWADLAWSPYGSQILAYNANPPGLWLARFSPGLLDLAVQPDLPGLANVARGTITSAAWSPDGRSVAFVLGGEAHQFDVSSGQTSTLTNLEQNPLTQEGAFGTYDIVREVAWSANGTQLALALSGTNCPSPCNGVGLLDPATGGEPTLLFDMAWMEGWLPDGRLMVRNATGDWTQGYTYDCYAHDLASGEKVNLTRSNPEYDPLLDPVENYVDAPYQIVGCQAGPDGKIWAALSDYSQGSFDSTGWPALGFVVVDPAAGEPQVFMPEGGQHKTFQQFLADGRIAYATAERAPEQSERWLIHSVVVDGETIDFPEDVAALLANGVHHLRFSPDGRTLAALVPEGAPPEQQTFRVEFINLD